MSIRENIRLSARIIAAAAVMTLFAMPSLAANTMLPVLSSATPRRSMWVWDTRAIQANDAAEEEFFKFAAAPRGVTKNAISVLYFDGVNLKDLNKPDVVKRLRGFLKRAHAQHLRVDFLTGDPTWATAEGQPEGLRILNAVIAFNQSGAPAERYDGFQYDVEPYSLPGWPSPALRQGMLDLLDQSNAAIRASGQTLILTAAIPRWYDQPQYGFLDEKIIDRTDEVLIMDYVNDANRLVADAMGEIDYAAKVGKKVWVGVEANDLKDTPRNTFFGLGNAAMEGVLSEALPRFASRKSFAGYAIHHWAAYTVLKP